jgi:hypothetical protein
VVSLTVRPLYLQVRRPWYPLDRRLQSRSERGGEEKNSQPLLGLEHLIIQLVAQRYTAELTRLQFTWPVASHLLNQLMMVVVVMMMMMIIIIIIIPQACSQLQGIFRE